MITVFSHLLNKSQAKGEAEMNSCQMIMHGKAFIEGQLQAFKLGTPMADFKVEFKWYSQTVADNGSVLKKE